MKRLPLHRIEAGLGRCLWMGAMACGLVGVAAAEVGGSERQSSYEVIERGPHHRVWQRVAADGVGVAGESYTELATGMHYIDTQGQWAESLDLIESFPSGAVARHGPHRVIWAGNLASPGAVDMELPDGHRVTSHLIGLAYYDWATGKSVLIAEVKDCQGKVLPPNQVIYEDALTDLPVMVVYTYTKSSFEQDVILLSQVPPPEKYSPELDPETTVLQVLTEFVDFPVTSVEEILVSTDSGVEVVDQVIGLGAMHIGKGRAFSLSGEGEVPIRKRWGKAEGNRNILIEEAPVRAVQERTRELPVWEGAIRGDVSPWRAVSDKRLLPPRKMASLRRAPMEIASQAPERKGFLWDYLTINGGYTNFTFKGQETYYISGAVTLSQTTTLEPGTVLKFAEDPTAKISLAGSLAGGGLPYQPVVLTSKNDNTAGQSIAGSTGTPNNTNSPVYLEWSSSHTAPLSYLRVRFANTGFKSPGFTQGIWHSQFYKCGTAVQVTAANQLHLRNVLIAQGTNCVSTTSTVRAEHLTADQCSKFCALSYGGANLTNSLLSAVTTTTGVSLFNSASFGTSSGLYQTLGAGNYYLAAASTNRDAGTTNLHATLLNDLKYRTTYPPVLLTSTITTDTVLGPVVARDATLPDRGYHYDSLDYCVSNITVTNCTFVLTNGVAVAAYNSGGVQMRSGKFISEGAPNNLNRLTRYETVQEQPILLGATDGNVVKVVSGSPEVRLRFTDLSFLGGGTSRRVVVGANSLVNPWELSHCQLRGLYFSEYANTSGINLNWTNNLFYGCNVDFYQENLVGYYSFTARIWNNLFYGGTLSLRDVSSFNTWTVRDNLFDVESLSKSGTFTADYNGYRTGLTSLGGSNNKTGLTMDYQSGAATNFFGVLGGFYYPSWGGSLTQLIDTGSRTAATATLYHFTTIPDQYNEGSSPVDIGYHYVALNANGLPVDSDGDGVPDYLEDRNGNGAVDSGETDPGSNTDSGLQVRITEPKRNSNLP